MKMSRTEEGTNISKMNAVSHALTANLIVLCTEDKARFDAMLEAYVQELKPVGIEENDLLEEIVVGKWRQKRLWGVESSILEMAMLEADKALEAKFCEADEGTSRFPDAPDPPDRRYKRISNHPQFTRNRQKKRPKRAWKRVVLCGLAGSA